MLPIKEVYNSYYFIFPHIYYYCEEEKKVSFHLLSSEIKIPASGPMQVMGWRKTMNKKITKASKKFTKKLVKAEKKHPVITTGVVIAEGAATVGGLVLGGITLWKNRAVLKNLRNQQTPPPQPQPQQQPQVPPTGDPNATSES